MVKLSSLIAWVILVLIIVLLSGLSFSYSHPDIYHVRPKDGSRVIQPYSCHDPATKEEGVCMFSWNCQRSNGTHLTYCMDRFYFGSCCRLPPGVFIATPPPISSNEVTEFPKLKTRPTTQQTTESVSNRWYSASGTELKTTTKSPIKRPTKYTQTDIPFGLVTWRPSAETINTRPPIKKKPTKLYSNKPLFAASTNDENFTESSYKPTTERTHRPTTHKPYKSTTLTPHKSTTERTNRPSTNRKPKPTTELPYKSTTFASTIKTKQTTIQVQSSLSTSVSTRRRTRPTKPHGSTNPKRRTRPTRPYAGGNSSVSRMTQTSTKITTPSSRSSTTSRTSSRTTTKAPIGTWSNILDRTTPPLPFSKKTTTESTKPSIRPTSTPIYGTTKRTSVTRRRTKPTRPQHTRITPSRLSSTAIRSPQTTRKPISTVRTTKKHNINTVVEIITFPPFPGVTQKSTYGTSTVSTFPENRRTTTFRPRTSPRSTTVTVHLPSVTESTTVPTEEPTTTEKVIPGMEFTKVCGKPRPGPVGRVVGGGNSYFGEWPWVVSLRQWKKNAFLHKCGATLLNEFWAITAAHCVENVPLTDILLRLGEYDISNENEPLPFVERRIQIVASHPQFDRRTFEYDLALLRFYEPVTFQKNILPVCIPSGNDSYIGKYATVTGWGRLYEDGPLPDVIQEVTLPIITNKLCENMYRQAGFVEEIPDIFICAGYANGGKDSCEGDSGGPMVLQENDGRWVLAGVISWGIGCALPNQPGVYTRITKFSEWINQIIIF